MPFSEVYRKQAALVAASPCPKLRARTASRSRAARAPICSIGDMPRLSVDIDLDGYLSRSGARAISRCYRRGHEAHRARG